MVFPKKNPLFEALRDDVAHRNLDKAIYLLLNGADLCVKDEIGRTAIQYTTIIYMEGEKGENDKQHMFDSIHLLISYGIDPCIPFNNGDTILSFLFKHFQFKSRQERYLLRLLLSCGVPPQWRDMEGNWAPFRVYPLLIRYELCPPCLSPCVDLDRLYPE